MNCYCYFPDNFKTKDVFIQAAGLSGIGNSPRHVLMFWINGVFDQGLGKEPHQIIELGTSQFDGSYTYRSPHAELRSLSTKKNNTEFLLGTFTRGERDKILDFAAKIRVPRNLAYNACQRWIRELLLHMVKASLISREKFDEIEASVPLSL